MEKNFFQTEIGIFKQQLVAKLAGTEKYDDVAARQVIGRYIAAIEGNFVSWMAATAVSCRSLQARFAVEENLYVEMHENHPGMLRSFAKAAGSEPCLEDFQAVQVEVDKIRVLVGEMSGLKNLTLMAALENTSAVFIPVLAELARNAGSKDLSYTDIHGEADVAHAEQFLWALEYESKHYTDPEVATQMVLELASKLLECIFSLKPLGQKHTLRVKRRRYAPEEIEDRL